MNKTEYNKYSKQATNALKEVTVETGLVVKVPMFINQGDKIIKFLYGGA